MCGWADRQLGGQVAGWLCVFVWVGGCVDECVWVVVCVGWWVCLYLHTTASLYSSR